MYLQFISTIIHTFDASSSERYFQVPAYLLQSASDSHIASKERSLWQRDPGVSIPHSGVMHVKKVVDRDRATCGPQILGQPAAHGRMRGNAAMLPFAVAGVIRGVGGDTWVENRELSDILGNLLNQALNFQIFLYKMLL